jgi:hypothetical protein
MSKVLPTRADYVARSPAYRAYQADPAGYVANAILNADPECYCERYNTNGYYAWLKQIVESGFGAMIDTCRIAGWTNTQCGLGLPWPQQSQ